MDYNFSQKCALVTGGCGGIGKAIVEKLISCGAKVIAVSDSEERLGKLKAKFGDSVETLRLDLTDWNETERQLQSLTTPIDYLVNSAGIVILESVGEISQQAVDSQFGINCKAMINISQTIGKKMKERGVGGAIVNISSQLSQKAWKDHLVYAATKGAVDQVTRCLAFELAEANIRVNCVNPTVVWTELGKLAWADPLKANTMKSRIPLGRFAQPEEIANTVAFLLSDKSSMITGAILPIDGGFWVG